MSDKSEYWIADPEGVKARVFGTAALTEWTRIRGWTQTTEPTGLEFQWVRNEAHGGRGPMAHDAAVLHEGLGWFPCGPVGYDDPADEPPAKSSAKAPATSGDKKE